MIYTDAKYWILLFLFLGVVCFGMGFFSFRTATGHRSPGREAQTALPITKNHHSYDLVAESERYLSNILAEIKPVEGTKKSFNADTFQKGNEEIPVAGNSSQGSLWFCYPGNNRDPKLQSLIDRCRLSLHDNFSKFEEVPVMAADMWDQAITMIPMQDEPLFIGVNMTNTGLLDGKAEYGVQLYFGIPHQWQSVFLPQVMPGISGNLDSFRLRKQKSGDTVVFELSWFQPAADNLTVPDRIFNFITKTLAQLQALRAVRKI